LRMNTTFLRNCLPANSHGLFTPRRFGNSLGVPCICPRCDERPPKHIKPWNRWRWMAFHEMTAHKAHQD
jgi:hypothetical protein